MKEIPYASVVDSIMYAVRYTRPDVAFSHNLTSIYQQNPSESHWTAVKKILKYLRNTKDMFPVYGGDSTTELSVTCYTDASSETDRDDLRSHTGYVFVMNGGTVDWKCSKQSTTAISSMEPEYIAAVEIAMEAIWIRKFIYGLGVVSNNDRPMDMYCDNTGAITIADEPGVQKGSKHFDENITLFEKLFKKSVELFSKHLCHPHHQRDASFLEKLCGGVQHVCLYMRDLMEPHLVVSKRILRYVHGTLDYGLHLYSSSTSSLVAYSDADWVGYPM
nr:retrotransposon protein, putative, Ty1-copia subclass [Tanacetum cinerariifolium]